MVQSLVGSHWRISEINGGRVEFGPTCRFRLPTGATGYTDAQIDDYGGPNGRFIHRPGVTMSLRARFSHEAGTLLGTAGFGFWNAPYGDPSRPRPSLPRAAWYFFGSPPCDLPFAPGEPGRGWFAATIDATTSSALALAPLAPVILALNQFPFARRRLWPGIRRQLGIHAVALDTDMREWQTYELDWQPDGCRFAVNGHPVLSTPDSVRDPLGFVCWIDNQFLVLSPRGRFRAGVLSPVEEQWMEVSELSLAIDRGGGSP